MYSDVPWSVFRCSFKHFHYHFISNLIQPNHCLEKGDPLTHCAVQVRTRDQKRQNYAVVCTKWYAMQSLDAILQCHGNNYLRHFLRLAIFIYSAKSQHKFYVFSDVAFKDAKKFIVFCCIWNVRKWPSFLVTLFKKTFWWIWSSLFWWSKLASMHFHWLTWSLPSLKWKQTEIQASWSLR